MIRIRALRREVTAPDGTPRVLLEEISAEAGKGDVVCIVGPSGGGKTTLLRAIAGLDRFDAGSIEVGGVTLAAEASGDARARARLRSKVGIVFQELHLFPHLTALENVALAPHVVEKKTRAEAKDRAMDLLRDLGLGERASQHPAQLSGGQRQRVAIARAIALPIDLLLLDEPTSALDAQTTDDVAALLRDLAARTGLTMVVVTHSDRLVERLATRVWEVREGRLAAR